MSKYFIQILSYCIITAASLTNEANCAEIRSEVNNGIVDNTILPVSDLPANNEYKSFFFPENTLMDKILPELRQNIGKYIIDPTTSNFMYLLQQPLSIRRGEAHIESDFPGTEGCGSWEIDNAVWLSIIAECPKQIVELSESFSCDPMGMAAWLGLVPRQCSSGGKQVLLGISKRRDRYLRSLLIHGKSE